MSMNGNPDCVPYGVRPETKNASGPAVTREEFETLCRQVSEIHAFVTGIAGALKNPMLRNMIPPQLKGMIGG